MCACHSNSRRDRSARRGRSAAAPMRLLPAQGFGARSRRREGRRRCAPSAGLRPGRPRARSRHDGSDHLCAEFACAAAQARRPARPSAPGRGAQHFHADPLRAHCQGGNQTAPICDAARRHDGDHSGGVHDLRNEHRRRDAASVTTSFATLGDDHVGTEIDCAPGLLDAHHLLHPQRAYSVHARSGQRGPPDDTIRRLDRVEDGFEHLGVEGRPVWLMRERSIGKPPQHLPPLAELRRRTRHAIHAAQPSCRADGGSQLDLMPGPERSADDRNVDTQQVAERCS